MARPAHARTAPLAAATIDQWAFPPVENLTASLENSNVHQLATILEHITEGITVADAKGKLIFANAESARLIGFDTPEELLRTPSAQILGRFEILHEDGTPLPLTELPGRQALLKGITTDSVVRFRVLATGIERWSQVKGVPVFGKDATVRYVINIFHDITEKVRERNEITFLADASEILSSSLDFDTTLKSLAQLIVPRLADWCTVDVLEANGQIQRLTVAHKDPAKAHWASELQRKYPMNPNQAYGVAHVLRTGKPDIVPEILDAMLVETIKDPEQLRILREIGLTSYMCVPLIARWKVLAALTFVTTESRKRYDDHDLAFAMDLGSSPYPSGYLIR